MEDLKECSENLRETMKNCCPPVHLSVLMRAYRIENGREVPFERYGYSNAEDFLRDNFPELNLVKYDKGCIVHYKDDAPAVEVNVANRSHISQAAASPTITTNIFTPRWAKKKEVPLPFRVFLRRIIDMYPLGITARDFVDVFYQKSGSPLSYQLYGYPGHLSMFKDLPDVFRLEQISDGEHKLYPVEKTVTGTIPNSNLNTRAETQTSSQSSTREIGTWVPSSSTFRPSKLSLNPVRVWKTAFGTFITVELDGDVLVPTGSVACMIGLSEDDVLFRLKQQGVDVRGVKFLSNEVPEHLPLLQKLFPHKSSLLIQGEACPVVSLIPIQSCRFILKALLEEPKSIQELTKEIRALSLTLGAS
ncbi:uncharacterized protein LOC100904921 [Galendromus occidentalis]|uniref:Uncharacterized protein LOC100904921 n=1 Tax=Galendromus occidentalis TaxID=34638 RepID=A0AAJ6W0M4_9ACAR|nr:uncharacterized protein LOC100904921 [Galendromus occidentalis]